MEISIVGISVAAIFWLITFVAQLVRVTAPSTLSHYELQRRAEAGDEAARSVLARRAQQPALNGFLTLIRYLAVVCATVTTVESTSLFVGLLVSFVVIGLILSLSRNGPATRLVNKLWDRQTAFQQKLAGQHWLAWFAPDSEASEQYGVASEQELDMMIRQSSRALNKQLRARLSSSIAFESKKVEAVMTPVSVVETINVNESLGPLVLDTLHKTGHSRFPVIDEDINHVVGMLYLHDIVELRSAKATVVDAMDSRVYFIRHDQTLTHALHGFLRTHHHLFIVVNEHRETVGVLSLEDVLESLIGYSIIDEFDTFDDLRAVAAKNPHHNNQPKGMNNV